MSENTKSDEFAIHKLAHAYSNALSRRDGNYAAATYAEDGILSAFSQPEIRGREAIAATLNKVLASMEFIVQTSAAGMTQIRGDTAIASWSVVEWFRFENDPAVLCCFGMYEDRLIRLSEGWRFSYRRFHPFYRGKVSSDGRSYSAPKFIYGLLDLFNDI